MSLPLPKKLVLVNKQCPGDILMLTAAVRDLKKVYPEVKIAVSTRFPGLWENNPYIDIPDKEYEIVPIGYKTPHQTRNHPAREHFIYAFHHSLERMFGISIPKGVPYPDLHLSEVDKKPVLASDKPLLLINAGSKSDFPIKQWPLEHFQRVVDACSPYFTVVQVGETHSAHHIPLKNVVDMVDKTPERAFLRLMYQSAGVVTGVSFPMHLCAGLNALKPMRKCVVLAGNREDMAWERYPEMCYLTGVCQHGTPETGCWKRYLPPTVEYSDEICPNSVRGVNGKFYARCLAEIDPETVVKFLLQGIFASPRTQLSIPE